jgi:hypothetical protein
MAHMSIINAAQLGCAMDVFFNYVEGEAAVNISELGDKCAA